MVLVHIHDHPDGCLSDLPDWLAAWGCAAVYLTDWIPPPPEPARPGPADGHGAPGAPGTPDAIFVSAELPGGARGGLFRSLIEGYGGAPVIVATRTRSLSQALEFFRAGAADYQPMPATAEDWRRRLLDSLHRRRAMAGAKWPGDGGEAGRNGMGAAKDAAKDAGGGARDAAGIDETDIPIVAVERIGGGREAWAAWARGMAAR